MKELDDFHNKIEEIKANILLKRESDAKEKISYNGGTGWRHIAMNGYMMDNGYITPNKLASNGIQQMLKRAEFANNYSSDMTLEALQDFLRGVKTNFTNKDIN